VLECFAYRRGRKKRRFWAGPPLKLFFSRIHSKNFILKTKEKRIFYEKNIMFIAVRYIIYLQLDGLFKYGHKR